MKLCWLLTTLQSNTAASAHRRPSLVSDKRSYVSVSVGVSRLWYTGVVFMQPGVKLSYSYTTLSGVSYASVNEHKPLQTVL